MLGTIFDETSDVNWRLEAITELQPSLDPHNYRAVTTMGVEEKAFLTAALAALPRVAEIISGYPPDDRAGALEVAERRFVEAARDYGCTDIAAQSRVAVVMKRLRKRVEAKQATERKLQALLQKLTEPK